MTDLNMCPIFLMSLNLRFCTLCVLVFIYVCVHIYHTHVYKVYIYVCVFIYMVLYD